MSESAQDWWARCFYQVQARRSADSDLFRHMVQVRDRYNGPLVFPLTDVRGEPNIEAPVPMILADAIDSHAMRAASQRPNIICPPIERTKPTGRRSIDYADTRRSALHADWFQGGVVDLILPRAYRHLAGYGTWNMIVTPDFDAKDARVELRDPLTAYPELRTPEDTRAPIDCAYVYGKSTQWLDKHYPEARTWIGKSNAAPDDLWDVCEWVDPEYVAIGLIGPRKVTGGYVAYGGLQNPNVDSYQTGMLLRRWDNRAGVTPIGTPRRATLDKIFGQVAQMVGVADMYGQLAALNQVAAEREVFPDIALIGNQIGRVPTLEGGRWADGRTGDFNTVLDGDVKVLQATPGPMTRATLSDMERAIRQSTGQMGALSGELNGSLRSGQTINSLSALTQDPRILESHRLTQRALMPVNEALMATKKGYWPDKKYTVFGGGATDSIVEYTPAEHFETFANAVEYPLEGMDAIQAGIALLQAGSSGLMPMDEIRHLHPLVRDAKQSHQGVVLEQAEQAITAAFNQHIMDGTTPIIDAVAYYKALRNGGDVIAAIEHSDEEARKRQATEAPPAGPGQVMSPEATSGIAPAGIGAEQPPPIPGPTAGQDNLEQLLYTLGRPQKQAV